MELRRFLLGRHCRVEMWKVALRLRSGQARGEWLETPQISRGVGTVWALFALTANTQMPKRLSVLRRLCPISQAGLAVDLGALFDLEYSIITNYVSTRERRCKGVVVVNNAAAEDTARSRRCLIFPGARDYHRAVFSVRCFSGVLILADFSRVPRSLPKTGRQFSWTPM